MKKTSRAWLRFVSGLVLCLTAAIIALIDALIPRTGKVTLNITLLAGLFVMGLILALWGLIQLVRNKPSR